MHESAIIELPVNGDIISGFVDNFNFKGVSISDLQGRPRKHAINSDAVVSLAQPLHWCCLDLFH